MTNLEALKKLYVANGGDAADVADATTAAEVIADIAGFVGIKDVNVQPEKASATLFGTKVSAMQSNVVVADGAITGTLKFIQGGLAPSGYLAGDGNFLALKFVDPNGADQIKVGLDPSISSGLVALDDDMNAVFKVTGILEGKQQVLKVVTSVDGVEKTQTFDLTGLVLETE